MTQRAVAAESKAGSVVTSGSLSVQLSGDGELTDITFKAGTRKTITGGTRLAKCTVAGAVTSRAVEGGGVQFSRKLVGEEPGAEAQIVETFRPVGDSIRWEVEITGGEKPWSTAIETGLTWPDPAAAKWWTAWGDRRPKGGEGWEDPLVPSTFVDRKMTYAGASAGPDSLAVSLVVVLDEACDRGLSLVLSPEDLALVMDLTVGADGRLVFSRRNHRIQAGHPVRFTMDLVSHPADWRSGLDWMVRRYPAYFDPPNPAVHESAGCGAYSSHAEINTPQRLHQMSFRNNWKASYDFPFMGMFLPPADEWIDFKHQKNSMAGMRAHSQEMRRMGFQVLNYFNVTELGAYYQYPPPPRKAASDADLWKDANDFLYYAMGEAILPGKDGKPIGSWCGCVVMDPGEKVYQDFLVEQARLHVEQLPESAGICIDRTDHLRRFDPRRDDGVSWVDGKPARSLVVSWREISERLGHVMHGAGKVIYVNLSWTAHLGWMRHVDGIYDEGGDQPVQLNRGALLGVRKPVMAWTRTAGAVRGDPDGYLQRHLHLGVYPTAPLPGNDHTILPAEDTDRYYLDYGPLLDALRGKRWVLRPHVIEVKDAMAKANLFEVPGAYVIPVTFGKGDRATVILHGLTRLPGQGGFRAEYLQPGGRWSPLKAAENGETLSLDVPLARGCAMVKLAYAWVEPKAAWFAGSTEISMGTTLRDAILHYTLDGSAPTANSAKYEKPLTLKKTTQVRAAAFRDDKQFGEVMSVEFVNLPPDAPAITPHGGSFDSSVEVTIAPPAGLAGQDAVIRYTLDGRAPTAESPRYSAPITLKETTTLRAAMFPPGREGCVASVKFYGRGPKPPAPVVQLSDLTPTRATTGWGGKPRMNRSITNKPLSLGGVTYAKGMGVHAESELEYVLKPEYRRFVSVVGLDDAMKAHPEGSVRFEVWIDGKRLEETRIFHSGEYGYLNVAIPAGSKVIKLVVNDAIDGGACDHGDWADAGFVTAE